MRHPRLGESDLEPVKSYAVPWTDTTTNSFGSQWGALSHQESDYGRVVHSFRNRTEVPRGWGGWEDGPMRIKERYQLAAELGERYWAAGRRERGVMLDAFCLTTGYSRKYAISILRGRKRMPRLRRKPRRRRYGKAFQADLAVLWEAAGYICAGRLHPFLPDLLPLLEKHRQLSPAPETRVLLLAASTSTISRNLVQLRQEVRWPRRSLRPPSRLQGEVPIRVRHWRQEGRPGYLEVDLVSHSGRWAIGEWIYTLSATDLETGWSELVPVMTKSQREGLAGLARLHQQLPFPERSPGRLLPSSSDSAQSRPPLPWQRQPPHRAEERIPGASAARQPAPGQRRAAGLAGPALQRLPAAFQQLLPARDAPDRSSSGRRALAPAPRHPSDPAPTSSGDQGGRYHQDRGAGQALHVGQSVEPQPLHRSPPPTHARRPLLVTNPALDGGRRCLILRSDPFLKEPSAQGRILS